MENKYLYKDYVEFFNKYLRFIYTRKIDRTNTCWLPNWLTNFEAIERLAALHIAYENAYKKILYAHGFYHLLIQL